MTPKKDEKDKKPVHKPAPKKKGRALHTHIEHHANGSHTVKHEMAEGAEPISYAAADMDGVKSGLDEHVAGGEGGPAEAPNPVMERLGNPTPMGG